MLCSHSCVFPTYGPTLCMGEVQLQHRTQSQATPSGQDVLDQPAGRLPLVPAGDRARCAQVSCPDPVILTPRGPRERHGVPAPVIASCSALAAPMLSESPTWPSLGRAVLF